MIRTFPGASEAPAPEYRFDGRNLLTVDVEDYFHATGLGCAPETWDSRPGRVEYNTRRLLAILADHDVHATFFVLGWVADRYPTLVREIHAAGHEVASHGYGHQLVHELDSSSFREDVHRARSVLQELTGAPVIGYRAPSFSMRSDAPWAFETLLETGHRYDSSVYPVRGARYGDPRAQRRIHTLQFANGELLEIPPSCVSLGPVNVPVAGGGYFRFFPTAFTHRAIRALNERESMPAVVYLHPWEIDPDQPRVRVSGLDRYRHYVNLERTESRLLQLLDAFAFTTIAEATGISTDASLETRQLVGGAA